MKNLNSILAIDSLLYSRSRKTTSKTIIVVSLSILASIFVSVLIAMSFGINPIELIGKLFYEGAIEWESWIINTCIFALSAFAFIFAKKAGVFNIGISGQMLMSGVVALAIINSIPNEALIGWGPIFLIFLTMLIGSLISTSVGLLKVYFNVNEVISSLLLNWVLFFVSKFLIGEFFSNDPTTFSASENFNSNVLLQAGELGGWLPAIIITLIVGIFIWVIFKFTTFGHKLKSVGHSEEASLNFGYNVKFLKLSSFAISGAIAGLLGAVLYTSLNTFIPISISSSSVPLEGFNGMAVGLIATGNPFGTLVVSALLGLFQASSPFLPTTPVFTNVILGFIMLGAAVSVVFFDFKPMSLFLSKKYGNKSKEELENFDNKMDSLISKYKFIKLNIKKNDDELTEAQENAYEDYQTERSNIFNNFRFNINKIKIEKELNPESEYKIISSNKNLKIDEDLTKYNSDQRAKIEKIKINMISRTHKTNDYKNSSDQFLKNRLSRNVDTENKFKSLSNKWLNKINKLKLDKKSSKKLSQIIKDKDFDDIEDFVDRKEDEQ